MQIVKVGREGFLAGGERLDTSQTWNLMFPNQVAESGLRSMGRNL